MTTTKPLDLAQFAGHTPGPWAAELDAMMPRGEHWIVRADSQGLRSWVAKIQGDLIAPEHGTPEKIAHLIAAAPALLAECQRLQAENERLREALQKCADRYPRDTYGTFAEARAALKGAE